MLNSRSKSLSICEIAAIMHVVAQTILALAILCFVEVESAYDRERYREIVYGDHTNDDAINLDTFGLLKRSNFSYEEYYVVGGDGYVSQLVRIINPKANRTLLKKPPIIVYHGANIDMTCYLSASSIQHFPEKYPRSPSDPPMTSSNRSLGFVLANNGFDVWLVGTRGSNRLNLGHIKDSRGRNVVIDLNGRNITKGEMDYARNRSQIYWQFGQDDVINYEVKVQIDKVRNITGSREYFLFSYSLSTPTTLAFFALYPEYAKDCRAYIQMAPAIAASHVTSQTDKFYFEQLCPLFPTRGIGFTPTYLLKPTARLLVPELARSDELKYSLIYGVTVGIFGPSPIYNTNLERNLLAHVFMPTSFKTVQQYCQNSVVKQFRKFDYGPVNNLAIYGRIDPPAYNYSRLEVQNYLIISGSNDGLADTTTVNRLKNSISTPTPIQQIIAPLFNHLDMIGAVETDNYINLPFVAYLNRLLR